MYPGQDGQRRDGAARTFLKKAQPTNFGRTERIDGTTWTTLIDVDIDDQLSWSLVIDTQQITGSGESLIIGSRVMARVEVGSGNGFTEQIIDATDLVALPLAGNHIKVAVTLASAIPTLTENGTPVLFTEPGGPGSAPEGDMALVSAFLSAESGGGAMWGPDYPVPLVDGPTNALLVATVPIRMRGYSAFNPSGSPLYLVYRNTANLDEVGLTQNQVHVAVLPPNELVQRAFPAPLPFSRGMVWNVCTDPVGTTISAAPVRVDVSLLRQPRVQAVAFVNPTS